MFEGSNVAVVTPFTDDGSAVDYDRLREHVEFLIENKTDGIMPAGCTGEAATLSIEEQQAVIKFVVDTVAGRCKVVAGAGSNNTKEALMLARCAADFGADGVMVISPYYNKPTQEGLYLHYKMLAEECKIPVMLYNIPGRTGIKIEAETVARLFNDVENIVSIKEACGSLEQVCQIRSLCDIEILSGDDALALPMASVGGRGVVSVIANIFPAECKALTDAYLNGDYPKAREWQYKLLPLIKAMFVETNPIPVKAAMKMLGRGNGVMRMPLLPISDKAGETLKTALLQYGLL